MGLRNNARQGFVIRMIFFLTYAAGAAWLSYFNLFLKQYVGLTDGQIGIVTAIQQINTLLLLPFWGMVADRFGRKNILVLNMILVTILLYGFIFQKIFISVLAFTYLFTLFYNPIVSLVDSIALDYLEQSGKSSYGSIRLWASIGWAVSSVITGYFVRPEKIYLIFPIASSVMLLNWLILKFIYRPLKIIKNLQSLKLKHLGEIIMKDKRLAIILLIMFFYGIFSAPIHLFINVYYAEIGAAYYHVGYAYAFQALSEVPFFFFGRKIIEWTGSRRMIVITMLVTSLRMFAYSATTSPWIAISIGTIHGISLALFLVAFISFVHQFIPPEWRATGQSFVYAFYFGGGMAVGNLWTGFLANHIGMGGAMFVEGTLTLVLVIFTLFIFGTIRRISDRIGMKINHKSKFTAF
jgi:PPP family 3-phenylpropionic acid transporter